MSGTIEVLDTRAVQPFLDAFLRQVLSSPDASALEDGRSLLVRLLEAPGRPLDEPGPEESRGWVATRTTEPEGTRSITCWNEESGPATLLAEWKGASLDWWSVTVGNRSYVSRLAEPDQETAAGNEKTGASLGARAREQFRDWVRSHPRRRSYCPICSFENEENAIQCVMCGSAIPVAPVAAVRTPASAILNPTQEIEREPCTPVRPAPPRQPVARPDPPAAPPKERVSPIAAPHFEVVLGSYPSQRREALLALLREILRDSAHHGPSAEELIAVLPVVIGTRVSIVRARELSDKLRTADATVEIRRTRS